MNYFTFLEIKEQIFMIGQNGLIQVLIWLILLDIASGIIKSFKLKQSNSTTGLFGVLKHSLVILLVIIVSVYLPLFGYGSASDFLTFYLIVVYLISFTENWVQLGLPAPHFIIEKLEKLKDTMDNGNKITIETPIESKIEIKQKDDVK